MNIIASRSNNSSKEQTKIDLHYITVDSCTFHTTSIGLPSPSFQAVVVVVAVLSPRSCTGMLLLVFIYVILCGGGVVEVEVEVELW
ncbi:hypothetical protein L1987_84311 [Smallanthus sonchifolius]|uniref:Uncharacterized protein n=1 Tax=Smallanthus sonchifolius TaxID=185202 RepID=A0ACB8YFH9_9ASTR|nr:hypothetical protein L1987_84311 [Smallanthus sonchifolius]